MDEADPSRRRALSVIGGGLVGALTGCSAPTSEEAPKKPPTEALVSLVRDHGVHAVDSVLKPDWYIFDLKYRSDATNSVEEVAELTAIAEAYATFVGRYTVPVPLLAPFHLHPEYTRYTIHQKDAKAYADGDLSLATYLGKVDGTEAIVPGFHGNTSLPGGSK